jgi:hypothetical protein
MAKIDNTLNPDDCQTLGGSPQFALGFGTYIGCLLPDQNSNESPTGTSLVGPFIVLNISGPRFASPGEDISSRVHILVSNDGDEDSGPFTIQLSLANVNGSEQVDFVPIAAEGVNRGHARLINPHGVIIPANRLLEQNKITGEVEGINGFQPGGFNLRIISPFVVPSDSPNVAA